MSDFLFVKDHPIHCGQGSRCPQAVVQAKSGRWFITSGHPGFNDAANNADGYVSAAFARRAIRNREAF